MLVWKTGRITLFDQNERPVAEVSKTSSGWAWYISGQTLGGDVETCAEAMTAVERVMGIEPARQDAVAK